MGHDRELPPPLEMKCLNALWQVGEGNVEEVRTVVSHSRPLAYTTVLTLLDRLTRRGAVSRRKEGRGFRYQPTVQRDKLRSMALQQFLEYHFEGSVLKLKLFLDQPPEFETALDAKAGDVALAADSLQEVAREIEDDKIAGSKPIDEFSGRKAFAVAACSAF